MNEELIKTIKEEMATIKEEVAIIKDAISIIDFAQSEIAKLIEDYEFNNRK